MRYARGDRCEQTCCNPFSNPSLAIFTHHYPGRKDKICTGFARTMVINARIDLNEAEAVQGVGAQTAAGRPKQ